LREKALAETITLTVNFNANSGSGTAPSPMTVTAGSSITLPGASGLSRTGFTFGGWTTDSSGTGTNYDAGASFTPTGHITLYAKWNAVPPGTHTVIFISNGGIDVSTQVINSGSTATRPANPTRPDYTFDNWYSNIGLTTVYNFSTPVTGNIILYAKWNAVYTITYNINNGTGTTPTAQTANAETSVTLKDGTGFSRTGYTFGGWNTDTSGTGTNYSAGASFTPTASITLYAKWTPNTYTVSFNADSGTPAPGQQTVNHDSAITQPPAMTKSGYIFDAWYKESTFMIKWDFSGDAITDNTTLYAKWLIAYTVNFNADSGTPAPAQQLVAHGGIVPQPPAMSRTGFTFGGWYKEPGLINEWNFASDFVTGTTTLYAKWNIIPGINLTANEWRNGNITSTSSLDRYSFSISNGSTYRIWVDDSDATSTSTTANVMIMGYYSDGTQIWPSHQDQNWDNPASFTADRSGTVYIDVTPYNNNTGTYAIVYSTGTTRPGGSGVTSYAVSYNINGGSGATPSPQTANSGANITLPSGSGFSRSGYTFSGWNTNSSSAGTNYNAGSSYTVIGSVTLYARWELVTNVPGANLVTKLSWLNSNAQSGVNYTVEISADESIGPQTLSYSGKNNINITLKGMGATRTINLSSNGSLFTIGAGVTLVLDSNLTLLGRSDNSASVVNVGAGGTLSMKAGTTIRDNTTSGNGGGVNAAGTFTMNGGTITANTAVNGGGVYVTGTGTFTMSGGTIGLSTAGNRATVKGGGVYLYDNGSTFTKTGGTIYGLTGTNRGNRVENTSNTILNNSGHAVYAYLSRGPKFKDTDAGSTVNLSKTGTTFSGAWDN
jgi:uncharacterized repeat protein (TIGR02543 family)